MSNTSNWCALAGGFFNLKLPQITRIGLKTSHEKNCEDVQLYDIVSLNLLVDIFGETVETYFDYYTSLIVLSKIPNTLKFRELFVQVLIRLQ